MTVELLQPLAMICFILSGAFFLLAVALFFLFNVPKLYGELSGNAARRAIESFQQQSAMSGVQASPQSRKSKAAIEISPSGTLQKRASGISGYQSAKSGRTSESSSRMRRAERSRSGKFGAPSSGNLTQSPGTDAAYMENNAAYAMGEAGTMLLQANAMEATQPAGYSEVMASHPADDDYMPVVEAELGYMESNQIIE